MSKLEKLAIRLLSIPLEKWSDGQLKFETASLLNLPSYITLSEHEKEEKKLPFTRKSMIEFLHTNGKYK